MSSDEDVRVEEARPDPRLTNDPARIPPPARYSAAEIPVPEKEDQPEKPDPRLSNDPERAKKPTRYSAADPPPKTNYYRLHNDTEETSLITTKPNRYSAAETDYSNRGDNGGDDCESFISKCKRIKAESKSFPAFVFGLLALVTASIFATVLIVISLALPIAMLAIGVHYKDDCSGEDMIPIYLIVAGAVGIAKDVVNILDRCLRQPNDTPPRSNNMERLFNLFLFAWLITGCVYVYRFYDDVQTNHPQEDDYCNHTVYWFTFWINTISLVFIGLGCLMFCLFTCLVLN